MKTASPLFWFLLFLSACATANRDIPTVEDQKVRFFVEDEGWQILKVSEKAPEYLKYKFHLAKFAKKNILGASVGNHEIYINYELGRMAMTNRNWLWVLRKTLAHEIGHDVARHAPNQQAVASIFSAGSTVGSIMSHVPGVVGLAGTAINLGSALVGAASVHLYTRSAELEADRKGIEYFKKLGWDCRVWTRILKRQLEVGDTGDFHHPTEERLTQALELCLPPSHPERIETEKWLAERSQAQPQPQERE